MAPTSAKARRISYVVPPPPSHPPRLLLPSIDAHKLGRTSPNIIYASSDLNASVNTPTASYFAGPPTKSTNPQHRLGVTALALDTTTTLAGHSAPEGILYSGGRDGLVVAWEQNTSMRRRKKTYGAQSSPYHWEEMTGWDDGDVSEDEDDEDAINASAPSAEDIPHWDRWEPDYDAIHDNVPGAFRQCVQAHTDWINDIVLCNSNRTVVSASNDGTLKAWTPHASDKTPTVIGDHMDYVRCVVYSHHRNWVASGSFDRTIKLWDLEQPRAEPLTTLETPSSSVYALATHPLGQVIAAGSPERVVRLWDLRSGKRVSKLVGHTDNIRALLLSEDGKYMLSGSSDATVKLWSLTAQRCLHTFSYHTDSVWTLASNHPNLEVFYSGDRSGMVCKVDVENCSDISEGECVVVCKDTPDLEAQAEGVNKVLAMDDAYIWTATSSSSIKRWSVPRRRADRGIPENRPDSPPPSSLIRQISSQDPFVKAHHPRFSTQSTGTFQSVGTVGPSASGAGVIIPYPSLVKLASPRELYHQPVKVVDTEIATLYSAASIRSVPPPFRPYADSIATPSRSQAVSPDGGREKEAYEERELAIDAVPLNASPNDVLHGSHGLVRSELLNDRLHALTVDTAGAVALWDVVRCLCLGTYTSEDVAGVTNSSSNSSVSGGGRERSPREALETVREKIEGEAVCPAWATVDTKIGHLTVHLVESRCFDAEVYWDETALGGEVGRLPEDHKLNIGKWVLTNLFRGFVQVETDSIAQLSKSPSSTVIVTAPTSDGTVTTPSAGGIIRGTAPTHIKLPAEGRRLRSTSDLSNVVQTPGKHAAMTPALPPDPPPTKAPSSGRATPERNGGGPASALPAKVTFLKESALTPIPASPASETSTPSATVARTPSTVAGGAAKEQSDYFKGRARSGSTAAAEPEDSKESGLVTPGGGFMGRLRNFGKSSKRPSSADATAAPIHENENAAKAEPEAEVLSPHAQHLKALNAILSQPLHPTPETEAPTLSQLPGDIAVMISEETPDASGWTGIYSTLVSATRENVGLLEMAAPVWLLELLLLNKAPAPAASKLSFIVVAYDKRNEPIAESSRLTAGRTLRVRKILQYIRDKLEVSDTKTSAVAKSLSDLKEAAPATTTAANAPVHLLSSTAAYQSTEPQKPEDIWEIVCNGAIVPITMSIGAVRHYIWRQGNELTLLYRLKQPTPNPT